MSELRAGLADARRTPGARALDGRRWGTFGYALGYALGAIRGRQRPPYVKAAELVKVAAGLLLAAYLVHLLTAGPQAIIKPMPPTPATTAPTADLEPTRAERLAADKTHCWQEGDEPLAPLPGHAVVRFTNGPRLGETVYTADPELVGAAFDEALTLAGYADKLSQLIDPVALCV